MADSRKDAKHKAAMQKQKERVDAGIEAATTERGVALLLTGDGKGKSSSAFGMVMRALGYGQKVGVVANRHHGNNLAGVEKERQSPLGDHDRVDFSALVVDARNGHRERRIVRSGANLELFQ